MEKITFICVDVNIQPTITCKTKCKTQPIFEKKLNLILSEKHETETAINK